MTGRLTELACVVIETAASKVRDDLTRACRNSRVLVQTGSFSGAMLALCLSVIHPIPSMAAAPIPMDKPDRLGLEHAVAGGGLPQSAQLAMRIRTLDRLLAKTGLDVQQLVAQAKPAKELLSEGEGGPLVPALGRGSDRAVERESMAELSRLRRMESVLLAVPIAAPMTEYKLNSGFGYRRDPFRKRGAMHTGLDFGGPRNGPVEATAPGTVVEAGRAGAYGIMVVIDHGMGIETRYAHLSRALVRVGEKVMLGEKVGLMGRTGRATGPHLHYEIRVGGRPLNPKPFLEAGVILAGR
ncbi:MAG: M23 family metallopeptidase [Geminicoccaceae bacterium]